MSSRELSQSELAPATWLSLMPLNWTKGWPENVGVKKFIGRIFIFFRLSWSCLIRWWWSSWWLFRFLRNHLFLPGSQLLPIPGVTSPLLPVERVLRHYQCTQVILNHPLLDWTATFPAKPQQSWTRPWTSFSTNFRTELENQMTTRTLYVEAMDDCLV